jgi:hypothetical protein
MNKRIRELAEQNRFIHNWMPSGEQYELLQRYEKFAELIVRECAKVSEDDITDGDACCTNTAYRIASQIKEHFGVA